ncbi:MAG: hypothetical protein EPO16_12880 [Dehalococcoidia bacterium]|nr:MAG: hypothetical protein EPO16_12880 [Dehalococcoidia bacterium]
MLGVQALTIDATRMFVERRHLQNAADAAVLAAVSYLPAGDPTALGHSRDAAIAYASLNGVQITAADVTFTTVGQANDRVRVDTETDILFAFARTFGLTDGVVRAHATAQVGQLGARGGVLPLGVVPPVEGFQMGAVYCLTLRSSGNSHFCPNVLKADFQALDIDNVGSSSTSVYRDRIASGSLTTLRLGDIRSINSGGMNEPTQQGFQNRVGTNTDLFSQVVEQRPECVGQPGCRYDVLDWDHPRIGFVAVVEDHTSTATVIGFAIFFLEQNPGNGNIVGRFVETVVPGGAWAPFSGSAYGAYVVRLAE